MNKPSSHLQRKRSKCESKRQKGNRQVSLAGGFRGCIEIFKMTGDRHKSHTLFFILITI